MDDPQEWLERGWALAVSLLAWRSRARRSMVKGQIASVNLGGRLHIYRHTQLSSCWGVLWLWARKAIILFVISLLNCRFIQKTVFILIKFSQLYVHFSNCLLCACVCVREPDKLKLLYQPMSFTTRQTMWKHSKSEAPVFDCFQLICYEESRKL